MSDTQRISGRTKTIALIGSPVGHSMSPAMHNAAFEKLGLDYVYVAFDVQPDQVEAAVKGMQALGFAGFNITMPLKAAVIPYLDELSDAARLMGAVNCVVLQEDGRAIGHNTDGAGFMRNIKENGIDVVGKKMTIVGAGGAGSAIYTQAALDGMGEVAVFNRGSSSRREATEARIAQIRTMCDCDITLHDLEDEDDLRASIAESQLFVNASRVGMAPDTDACVISEDMLREDLAVADVVYNPMETKLLSMAKAHGCKAIGGLGMLLWQAAIGEKLWTGQEMPVDYIKELFY